jgi:MurNAc alpha-1-phosphate uridylyltransferase
MASDDQRLKTAMVLAAGLGRRMRPLTADRPKPLVEVGGRMLIDRVLDRLAAGGVRRAVVNVHYMGDQIIEATRSRTAPQIIISEERDELLDTGGGVLKALPSLGDEAFIVHNSDSIWVEGVDDNLARLNRYWDPAAMDCLMLLAMTRTSTGYDARGDFTMSSEGVVERRGEHEMAPFAYTGVSIMHPRLFVDAPEGAFSLNRLWDRAIANGRLYGLRLEGRWMHVGSPLGLAQAEELMAARDE